MTSNDQAPSLLHVGYPKTASTYLQQAVFDNPEIGFGLPGGATSRGYLIDWFRTRDAYLFDPTVVCDEMEALEAPVRGAGLRPVWSDETLLGNPLTRTYDGAWILGKLARLNRPMKVVITIRKQQDLVLSAYREHLKTGRHTLTDFIGTQSEKRSYRSILHHEYLFYDQVVTHWGRVFGPDNVLVLPQEMLRADPDGFLNMLTRFAGVPDATPPAAKGVNVGVKGTGLVAARVLNGFYQRSPLSQRRSFAERCVRKTVSAIDRLSPGALDRRIEARWGAQIAARYDGVYEGSNQRLAAQTGLDLAALGYTV